MGYLEETLIFESDKIYYTDDYSTFEVMMDWEDEIMKKSADYICGNGGDILEIGFGMGISARYIQANNINSHTIVENHPQVIEKLKIWAQDKPNVIIIEDDWFNIKDSLLTYDGILYDTYGEEDYNSFDIILPSLTKSGTRYSWWNGASIKDTDSMNGIEFEIINIDPPKNNYFNSKVYYLPKKEF